MKKLFTLFTLVALFASANMAQIKLYVHQNDGSYTEFIANTVDSITFSEQKPEKDVANGYEYVDLGLTSGALWATCNLGADKPEEYGDYFAWGELKHKYRYEMNNYVGNASGKYDVYNILELEDDVVYKKMGGAWHIPSPAEINELKDECEWTWTSINNVNGYEVKGPNGNTIFLPAAGVFYQTLDNVGKGGIYRANAKIGKTTFNLHLDEKYGVRAYYENEAQPGHSIRPVCHKINEKYTLTFSANGGEGEMESMSLKYGEHRILPEVSFTRENHAYTTWNTKADGTGTSYNNKSQISITEDIVLYAQWREIKLIDGYEYIDLGLPSGLLWANQNIGASKPEEFGDYFAWGEVEPKERYEYDNYVGNATGKYNINEYMEMVDDAARHNWGGNWRIPLPEEMDELVNECTWTWTTLNNVNGYEVKGPNGNTIFLPAAGVFYSKPYSQGERAVYRGNHKRGSTFNLHFDEERVHTMGEMDKYSGFTIRPVCNKTTETYTLTFDANEGEGEMNALTLENAEYRIIPASNFTKEGFVWASWNTKADGSGVSYKDKSQINIKENTTLYAQWNEYMTISFDANSGEGSMEKIMLLDPQEIQLPANSFSKYGYVFNGWNTKADGTGVAYQNEELVTLEDNTVLYAQWKDCIILYFYPNGGEGEIVEIAVDEPQTVTIPVIDLKREGYVFVGWNAEPDGSARSYTTHIVIGDEDINLYAEWEKLVTISYDPNGGSGSVFTDEMQPSKGGKISENIFSRKGYLFVGWNTNVNGSGTSYAELEKVKLYSDTTLYAQWKKIEEYNADEYVDLGLSVKWATCNLGAEKPEEFGDYYAWGEVKTKNSYTTENYNFTAYPSVLLIENDAASVNWGGDWRMPTKAEFKELIDNCTMTTLSYGIKFTATNGNYIILPFGGFKEGLSDLKSPQYGYYWTSDLSTSDNSKAYDIIIGTSKLYYEGNRHCGLSVRPVLPK